MERVTIVRRYEAEVAHRLNAGVPEHHKCRRLHGHRYVVEVAVSGLLDQHGMAVEYGELDAVIDPIMETFDHCCANTLAERCSTPEAAAMSENPTVERLVLWIAARAAPTTRTRPAQGLRLEWVKAEEDSRSRAKWVNPA